MGQSHSPATMLCQSVCVLCVCTMCVCVCTIDVYVCINSVVHNEHVSCVFLLC